MLGMDKHSTTELHPWILGIIYFKRFLSPLRVAYFKCGPPWSISLFVAMVCPDMKEFLPPTPASVLGCWDHKPVASYLLLDESLLD